MEKNILRFNTYLKNINSGTINESKASISAVQRIIDGFFMVYSYLLPKSSPNLMDVKMEGFFENLKSVLTKIKDEKDNSKRADIMKEVLDAEAGKLKAPWNSISGDVNSLSTKMSDLFKYATSNESAKSDAAGIEKSILDRIKLIEDRINFTITKTSVVESRNTEGTRNVMSYENFSYRFIYEKRNKTVLKDERNSLISQIEPVYADMLVQQKTPATPGLKAKADETINKFNEINTILNNDEEWSKMKRRERKNKLEELSKQINEIITKLLEFQKKEISNLGMDNKTAEDLLLITTDVNDLIKKINLTQNKINSEASAESAKNYKVGDTIKYVDSEGDSQEGVITKIEGGNITIKRKDGKEVVKKSSSIEGKVEKQEEKKDVFKLEKTIKANGRRPRGKNKELSKKIFELICSKFKDNETITKSPEWPKAKFCSVSSYIIGPNRTKVIKSIKKGYGLDDKNADLTPELVQKLTA